MTPPCLDTDPSQSVAIDWAGLAPRVLHPTKVAVLEALRWVDEPLSALDLQELFDVGPLNTSNISFHLRTLAKFGAVELVDEQPVRGAVKRLYCLASPDAR